ncbi:molybdopterin-binding protein [Streptomyces sp. NPDC046727]|uniref:molybdopterin-binding protein n=1 Tax=Streptomyces sp. NPDC046727 TaxID=3155373 RepID=UPI0033EB6036
MDGWAVAGAGPWRLGGTGVPAGEEPVPLAPHMAVPITTGAPPPPYCAGSTARPTTGGACCTTARPSDSPRAATSGRAARSAAASGYDRLAVHRRPSVELLVLCDELLTSGRPRSGRVRDALGPLPAPWLRRCGAELIGHQLLADGLESLREAVRRSPADVVATTGSTTESTSRRAPSVPSGPPRTSSHPRRTAAAPPRRALRSRPAASHRRHHAARTPLGHEAAAGVLRTLSPPGTLPVLRWFTQACGPGGTRARCAATACRRFPLSMPSAVAPA